MEAIFTNLRTREGALSIETDLNVAGGSDLERVEPVTSEIASSVMASVDGYHTRFAPSLLPISKRECDRDGGVSEDPAQHRHREDQARIHQTANATVRERRYQADVSATFLADDEGSPSRGG